MTRPDKARLPAAGSPLDLPDNVRCTATKADGTRCRARRHAGSDRCFFHDDAERVRAAGRKGGDVTRQRRAKAVMPRSSVVVLESAEDLRQLLADTATRVRRGQLDVSVANSLTYLAQTSMRVLELVELERRLATLEARLEGNRE